jgi:4-aminobutyrate aminotransferase
VVIRLKTKIPGSKSAVILKRLEKKNGGWGVPHPLVFSGKGKGAVCEDIDGNKFIDFASQVSTNPLGYNYPDLVKVVGEYRKRFPIKYGGQDFAIKEHIAMIEELTGIAPKGMDTAFLVNSGAEAVENAIKICMRRRPKKKFTVSLEGAFHGRTLGALSMHHSKEIHRKGYMLEPNKELSFSDNAGNELEKLIGKEGAESVACVVLEHLQGEGGYRVPSDKMIKNLRGVCKKNGVPYVSDEVQAGMGRTGKWWAFEHYGVRPDVFASAKALQIGAVVARKKWFPSESGALSSTWGGGHVIDMALGVKTIEIIKKKKLLQSNRKNGEYIMKILKEWEADGKIGDVRGRGLMIAFDMSSARERDNVVIECVKRGLIVLGCGVKGIRIIPPFIIGRDVLDEGMNVLLEAIKICGEKGFRHSGKICNFMGCGEFNT